jgi:hypothetical protein
VSEAPITIRVLIIRILFGPALQNITIGLGNSCHGQPWKERTMRRWKVSHIDIHHGALNDIGVGRL